MILFQRRCFHALSFVLENIDPHINGSLANTYFLRPFNQSAGVRSVGALGRKLDVAGEDVELNEEGVRVRLRAAAAVDQDHHILGQVGSRGNGDLEPTRNAQSRPVPTQAPSGVCYLYAAVTGEIGRAAGGGRKTEEGDQ